MCGLYRILISVILILFFSTKINSQTTVIQVVSEPGVSVFLDGLYKGKTTSEMNGAVIENVTAGTHSIRVAKEGFDPQEEKITIKAGEVFVFRVKPLVAKSKTEVNATSPKKDDSVKQLPQTTAATSGDADGEKGSFSDPRDGEVYKTVVIGKQTWMTENLRASLYNDGSPIPMLSGKVWSKIYLKDPPTPMPGFCWYNNDEESFRHFGALYNWYAINTGKLCPAGWHVPNTGDWYLLVDYLGGINIAGGKLKERGTTNWDSPNAGATNESGFTAVGGSMRGNEGFSCGRDAAAWWSSTEGREIYPFMVYLTAKSSSVEIIKATTKMFGLPVRCIKDN